MTEKIRLYSPFGDENGGDVERLFRISLMNGLKIQSSTGRMLLNEGGEIKPMSLPPEKTENPFQKALDAMQCSREELEKILKSADENFSLIPEEKREYARGVTQEIVELLARRCGENPQMLAEITVKVLADIGARSTKNEESRDAFLKSMQVQLAAFYEPAKIRRRTERIEEALENLTSRSEKDHDAF